MEIAAKVLVLGWGQSDGNSPLGAVDGGDGAQPKNS